jgi:hypothetical protein
LAEGEPRQIGFGSDVIQRLIARDLHGMGELSFSASGMRCLIEIPLAEAPRPDE